MIHSSRIHNLNDKPAVKGKYVLYWMQQSQREHYNHALEYAVYKANKLGLPLIVLFCFTKFPDANTRHYAFMTEGLIETEKALRDRGIGMFFTSGDIVNAVAEYAEHAAAVITDTGYLRIQRQWRRHIAEHIRCSMTGVEADVLVPIETASDKEQYDARSIRSKLRARMYEYIHPLRRTAVQHDSLSVKLRTMKPDIDDLSVKLKLEFLKPGSFKGGNGPALSVLRDFIRNRLEDYPDKRNNFRMQGTSMMSPYLHFGQISPLFIVLEILKSGIRPDEYLEQLIVRRELAMNFTHYNDRYDTLQALPDWAQQTLNEHRQDERQYIYSLEQFEHSDTHDHYWNEAQSTLCEKGYMHNYMRMYWGKKIIEWTEAPEEALRYMIYLNNKYELDGRDPNGYTGILWCFGKHDRPWGERAVFGKVRYMNENSLRKWGREQ